MRAFRMCPLRVHALRRHPRPAGQRQRGDALPVAIEAEAARRSRQSQHGGIVGKVGVQPLGEIAEQHIGPRRPRQARQHARAGRVGRGIDRLVLADLRLGAEQQQRLPAQQRGQGRRRRDPPKPSRGRAQRRRGQHRQQRRHQAERRQDEHQPHQRRRPRPRAGQVGGIDRADPPRVQHEAQADEQPGQEEERQQRRVVAADMPQLARPGDGVLQRQRIERVQRRKMEPDRPRHHQRRRQSGQQRRPAPHQPVPRHRQRHAAERKPGHGDRDHPVAILGPQGDGEEPGERDLEPDRRRRDEEQRREHRRRPSGGRGAPRRQPRQDDQPGVRLPARGGHFHTRRRMKPRSRASNRTGSSTNRAWPAAGNSATSVLGRRAARLAACSASQGRTT